MRETKPRQLSCLPSIAYSDSRADFREVSTDQRFLYCRFGWHGPTNPNKPNLTKTFVINNMPEKLQKKTKRHYRTCYQLFTAILTAIPRNFGWMGGASLSRIRVYGHGLSRRGFQKHPGPNPNTNPFPPVGRRQSAVGSRNSHPSGRFVELLTADRQLRSDFDRTEATNLLKKKDSDPGPKPIRTHFHQSAVGSWQLAVAHAEHRFAKATLAAIVKG